MYSKYSKYSKYSMTDVARLPAVLPLQYTPLKSPHLILHGFNLLNIWTKLLFIGLLSSTSIRLFAAVPELATQFERAQTGEQLPGGAASSKNRGKRAFLQSGANLNFQHQLDFKIGESIFDKLWVFSPSSTQASDGLGPLHNARSCMGCHVRGGRGHVPQGNWPADNSISMLMRLSIPAQNAMQHAQLESGQVPFIAEPTYGAQLQDFALQGINAEGRIHISYHEQSVELKGAEPASLRVPSYKVTDLGYGPMHPATQHSVRVANPMIGLGLLEAIDQADILALADPLDANSDGISGRANKVWQIASQSLQLGRFGWKAGNPSIVQQNSAAFANDMGLSTTLLKGSYAGDCTRVQTSCITAPDGRSAHLGNVEVAEPMFSALELFVRNIGVPQRKDVGNKAVLAGKRLFYQSGCVDCHRPSFVTASSAPKEQAGQLIWPYTDMLLHDMGEGLADHRGEFNANGFEWRTAPLWGIGLSAKVSGKTQFLHDARARTLLEAILWHGGEAQPSRDKVVNMNEAQRQQLLIFLESL